MELTVSKEHGARHVCVVGGMAGRPREKAAAYDVTEAVGICGAYLGVAFELETGAKGVAGVEAEQGADDFGLAWGEGRSGFKGHYDAVTDRNYRDGPFELSLRQKFVRACGQYISMWLSSNCCQKVSSGVIHNMSQPHVCSHWGLLMA